MFYPAPRKRTFTILEPRDLEEEKAKPGDHIKVRCMLRRADQVEWRKYKAQIREIAEARKWQLFSMEPVLLETGRSERDRMLTASVREPRELVSAYVKRQKASDEHERIGLELLND